MIKSILKKILPKKEDDYYQEFLNKIEESKTKHIIAPEGIYTEGKYISNEQLQYEKEREEYMKECDEILDLEYQELMRELKMNDIEDELK